MLLECIKGQEFLAHRTAGLEQLFHFVRANADTGNLPPVLTQQHIVLHGNAKTESKEHDRIRKEQAVGGQIARLTSRRAKLCGKEIEAIPSATSEQNR